jgi:hypothetical protein
MGPQIRLAGGDQGHGGETNVIYQRNQYNK